jgi:glycosyltransferase involved in cell wall biosynthesis
VTLLQEEPQPAPAAPLPPLPENPLISVIVPTRDRAELLRDALESLRRQSYQNWEAVVVNDAGADVRPVLGALSAKGRCIELPARCGPAGARNAGLEEARGAILAFLDDDDLYAPDHLAGLVAALRASNAPLAYSAVELVEERVAGNARVPLRRQTFLPGLRYSRHLLLVRNYIPINAWGVRRESLAAAGRFDEALPYLEDWDLLLRLSSLGPFQATGRMSAEYRVTVDAGDSVTKRHAHRPAVEALHRRHDDGGHALVRLARELYLESL